MILAKGSLKKVHIKSKNDIDWVVQWFDQHQQQLIPLGWLYARNEQQLEELFHYSILNVLKKRPREKNKTAQDSWFTSQFIQSCQEFLKDSSNDPDQDNESRPLLFKVLDQLPLVESELIVLTYFLNFTREQSMQLLRLTEEHRKTNLYAGIRKLREHFGDGSTYTGCKEYQHLYMDYIERNLERPKKIELEMHLYHCQACQGDLSTFQDTVLTLKDEAERMKDISPITNPIQLVRDKLHALVEQKQKKTKKVKKIASILIGVFAILVGIGIFTGIFANTYYALTEEDEQLLPYLQKGFGERLNLVAESEGVKITIKSVVADEVQTLVFYEIEDTKDEKQWQLNYDDGVNVENAFDIMKNGQYPMYYANDPESELNKQDKSIFYGKMSLLPITKNEATIELNIRKLLEVVKPSEYTGDEVYQEPEFATGEWVFKIPVTKQPSKKYKLNEQTVVEGIPVRFDQFIMAPTATILQYSINTSEQPGNWLSLNLGDFKVNNKQMKSDMYGTYMMNGEQIGAWSKFQANYRALFDVLPKEVSVELSSAQLSIGDMKTIEIDPKQKYPLSFEYAGSTISIEKLEIGNPTTIVLSDQNLDNRTYENFSFHVMSVNEEDITNIEMESQEVMIDRNGKRYDRDDPNTNLPPYEEMQELRSFVTSQTMRLFGDQIIPDRLELFGYNKTVYLDEVIKLKLEK